MEITVSDGKTAAHATEYSHPMICLYKQECNHGTCVVVPWIFPSFFRCTRSSTIFGGPIHQGGNTKYEGVSKMCVKSMLEAVKNCLMRRPKVRMAFSLASKNFIYLLSNTASCVGDLGNDLILKEYCRESSACLAPKLGSCASCTQGKF